MDFEKMARDVLGIPAGINYPSLPKLIDAMRSAYTAGMDAAAEEVASIPNSMAMWLNTSEFKAAQEMKTRAYDAIRALPGKEG